MIVSLERLKQYLRIDPEMSGEGEGLEDLEILSMFDGAVLYFQKETNHILQTEERDYTNQKRIYDFPITDTTGLIKKANYYENNSCDELILEVGYPEGEVPNDIIQCLLQIVKVWYYESEKEENATLMPKSVIQVIEKYRRFWI
jgi:hypothetical protein